MSIALACDMDGKPKKPHFLHVPDLMDLSDSKCSNESSENSESSENGDDPVPLGLTRRAVCMQVFIMMAFNCI